MKFALHTSTAISSVLKEPEHFYVDTVSYTHLTLPTIRLV